MAGIGIQIKNGIGRACGKVGAIIKNNFVFATLNFIFIVAFIQGFQFLFGLQNSVVAIILTILMGIYAGRDVAASPVKQFVTHTSVLCVMCVAACFSVALGVWIAIPINLAVTFCILYAYTYEYSSHLYFPYILSYLFLVHISPVDPTALPLRLLSVVAGTLCMLFYAILLRPRNISKPARNALIQLLVDAENCVKEISLKNAEWDCSADARRCVYLLSKNAEIRRKGALRLSESAIAIIDAGRGVENLINLLCDPVFKNEKYEKIWPYLSGFLSDYRAFVLHKKRVVPDPDRQYFDPKDEYVQSIYLALKYVRDKLLSCFDRKKQKEQYMPLKKRIMTTVGFSPVRLVYAVRASVLLTAFMIPVQAFGLAHGKWLLFTLASVSLPYAEDVMGKAKKRLIATLIGGAVATVLFALISDQTVRTAIMMLSGYLSFYFKGYVGNYSCATVGALGGAVFSGATDWTGVSFMFGIRVGYILLGIGIALIANLLICPFHRRQASEVIYRDYNQSAEKIIDIVTEKSADRQLYYDLVIRNNLLEETLLKNCAGTDSYSEVLRLVADERDRIRKIHHDVYREEYEKTG